MIAFIPTIREHGKKPGVIAWTCIGMIVLLVWFANAGLLLVNANRSSYSFADVPGSSPFWEYAEQLYSLGVVDGTPCGGAEIPCDEEMRPYLVPGSKVTRGELARMLGLARGFTSDSAAQGATSSFADVAPTHPLNGWVEVAARNSLMPGFPCGTGGEPCDSENRPYFRTDGELSRADLADALVFASGRGTRLGLATRDQTFEDVPPTHPSWQSIEEIFAIGIMTGYGCNDCTEPIPCVPPNNRSYFLPDNQVTKGQVVKAVAEWLDGVER
jgi:hypothetical protein